MCRTTDRDFPDGDVTEFPAVTSSASDKCLPGFPWSTPMYRDDDVIVRLPINGDSVHSVTYIARLLLIAVFVMH